jgi:hypothetical protein
VTVGSVPSTSPNQSPATDRSLPFHTDQVSEPDSSEQEYLRQIELLAIDVVDHAQGEGWLSYQPDPDQATPLQRAVNELARQLRHQHFDGDGCLDSNRPVLHLGGAALITPGRTAQERDVYRTHCGELGVEARSEGWALWHTWDSQARPHTIVTTALATTTGLLDNWSHGRDVHPVQPHRSQIAAVVNGWAQPIILSPSHATTIGLGGR